MIISYSKNFIFLHYAKTAGSSVTAYLVENISSGDYANRHEKVTKAKHRANLSGYVDRHGTIEDARYFCHLNRQDEFFKNAFKFCFVRNPFDRLHSYHNHVKRKYDVTPDFNKWFAESYLPLMATRYKDFSRRCYLDQNGLVGVDHVAKYENLEDELIYIYDRIGVPAPASELPKINRAKHRGDYRDHYNSWTREMVTHLFRDELERFDYEF